MISMPCWCSARTWITYASWHLTNAKWHGLVLLYLCHLRMYSETPNLFWDHGTRALAQAIVIIINVNHT